MFHQKEYRDLLNISDMAQYIMPKFQKKDSKRKTLHFMSIKKMFSSPESPFLVLHNTCLKQEGPPLGNHCPAEQ